MYPSRGKRGGETHHGQAPRMRPAARVRRMFPSSVHGSSSADHGAAAVEFALLLPLLLLIVLGGLLVIEVMSVVLQVGYFKLTHGKRIFKMSPIHHHFELLNWAQVTIVMRFWIICGLFVAGGLGIFYAEWVAGS